MPGVSSARPLPPDRQQNGEQLFAHYRRRALALARSFYRRVPPWLTTQEEMESVALEGLWLAVLADRPARGDWENFWPLWVIGRLKDWLAFLRRQRQRETVFSAVWTDEESEWERGHHLPDPLAEAREADPRQVSLAQHALSLLVTKRQRQLFELHYWYDLPLRLSGEMAGYRGKAAYSVHADCLTRLRRLMGPHAEDAEV